MNFEIAILLMSFAPFCLIAYLLYKKKPAKVWDSDKLIFLQNQLLEMDNVASIEDAPSIACRATRACPQWIKVFELALKDKQENLDPNNREILFNKRQKRARRSWIWLFMIDNLFTAIVMAPIILKKPLYGLFLVALIVIRAWITYDLNCQKKETLLLRFGIAGSGIIVLGGTINMLSSMSDPTKQHVGAIAFTTLFYALYGWSCLKLCQVNAIARGRKWIAAIRSAQTSPSNA